MSLKSGKPRAFTDVDAFEEAISKYIDWVKDNPIKVDKKKTRSVFTEKNALLDTEQERTEEVIPRAMSIPGFAAYYGISSRTYYGFKNLKTHTEDDVERIKEIEGWFSDVMHAQKFEGAASNRLNANIISRDLGLADKKEITQDVSLNDMTFTVSGVSP